MLNLPQEIYDIVKDLKYKKDSVGCSEDEVYIFEKKYILKISSNETRLYNEKSKTDWIAEHINSAKSIKYIKKDNKYYYLRTYVDGIPLIDKKFMDNPFLLIDAISNVVKVLRSLDDKNCPFLSSDSVGNKFVHGDLCLPNIYVDKNNNFVSFIDTENSGLGDEMYDYSWLLWSFEYNLGTNIYNNLLLNKLGTNLNIEKYNNYLTKNTIERLIPNKRNYYIRLVKKEEFYNLMEVMNSSFEFFDSSKKFQHILPKLYYEDNKDMLHLGLYENDILVSSIGLYFMDMVHGKKTLKTACVGAVSTLKEYRNKGYFSILIKNIINIAKAMDISLLFLGGNRIRYGNYGFEKAGRSLVFELTKRTKQFLDSDNFMVKKISKNDTSIINKLLKIYRSNDIYVKRSSDNFYDTLLSWNSTPYYVYNKNKILGYFSISESNIVTEIGFNAKTDILFNAILSAIFYQNAITLK